MSVVKQEYIRTQPSGTPNWFKWSRNKSELHFLGYKIGLSKTIDHVFDIIKADYIPKPDVLTYKKVIKEYSLIPKKTIMIDDLPNNLKTAKELGIKTVLIKKDFFNGNTYNYIDIICDNLLNTIKKINKGLI